MNSSQTSYSQVESSTVQTDISHVTGGGENKSCTFTPQTQRIEYIDALRGFTMILVVMTHVSNFCLCSYNSSYSIIMTQFRMPLFFFISGFVFYKDIIWNKTSLTAFFKKKIPVQILTPTLFLLLYLHIHTLPITNILLEPYRNGYWFTYILFLFFILYVCIEFFTQHLKIKSKGVNLVLMLCCGLCYTITLGGDLALSKKLSYVIMTPHWQYFTFFVIGTFAKKYFYHFLRLIDNKYFLFVIIAFFFLSNIFDKYLFGINSIIDIIVKHLRSFSGIWIVFAFFRKHSLIFTKEKILGHCLQYIGRRTLDVYLLHYFFLPWGLASVFTFFADNNLPSLEIFASLFIALLVISLCLIISNVYRLSPWIEQNMFGVKKKKE